MGLKWKDLIDTKGASLPWLLLGLAYLLINLFAIGSSRPEFPYGIAYAVGFISVAIVLSAKTAVGYLSGLMCAIIGMFTIFVSMSAGIQTWNLMWIVVVFFAFQLANEYEIIEWKKRAVGAKYLGVVAMIGWFAFALQYFWNRLSMPDWMLLLPAVTILNHGGLMFMALNEASAMFIHHKSANTLRWIALLVIVIGALGLLSIGWGLYLYPAA